MRRGFGEPEWFDYPKGRPVCSTCRKAMRGHAPWDPDDAFIWSCDGCGMELEIWPPGAFGVEDRPEIVKHL